MRGLNTCLIRLKKSPGGKIFLAIGLIIAATLGLHISSAAAGGGAISSSTTFNISNAVGGGDCTARGIGTWNQSTLTCTLTSDVTMTAAVDGIQIDSDGVTLDGNGHTLTGNGSGESGVLGVYLSGRTRVTVRNLNVTNFNIGIGLDSSSSNVISGNTANSNGAGIDLENTSDNNTISANTADSNYTGINLANSSSNNFVSGNTADFNVGSILSAGILVSSSSNTISGNTANSNGIVGIELFSSTSNNNVNVTGNTTNSNFEAGIGLFDFNNNEILNNSTMLNAIGIAATDASSNTFSGNTISAGNNGIVLDTSSTGSNNNIIYRNNFIGNTTQASVEAGSTGNVFNLPLPAGGNYWSNWTSPDSDNDGIVDSPYVFSGGQDNLPWTSQNGWLNDYFWTWYDNQSPGAKDWVLLSNPAGSGSLSFRLKIAGSSKALPDSGLVGAGKTLYAQYPGLMGGPVDATKALPSGAAVTSQRTLWAGNSLEEVLGQRTDKLSNDYFWTWYDNQSSGYTNWILIANTGMDHNGNTQGAVTATVKIGGSAVWSGSIPPGGRVTPTFPGRMGGPVEVTSSGGDVMASQRVLSNYGSAFNEVPGVPASSLADTYLWTWYDNQSPGAINWVLVANPPGAPAPIYYNIFIGSTLVKSGGPIAPGHDVTPAFPGRMGGPVKVVTFNNPAHPGVSPAPSICSQRSVFGPSFEEVPGSSVSSLAGSYNWTWYDNQSPGMSNWVLVANPGTATVNNVTVKIAGKTVWGPASIGSGAMVTPTFPGKMGGPVQVSAGGNVIASQRVLYNGYFNEVLGE